MVEPTFLVRFERDRFEPRGVNGEPVWRSVYQIHDVLGQRLGDRHVRFFSIPSLLKGEEMGWSSARPGEAVGWAEVGRERRAVAAEEVAALLRDIDMVIRDLRERGADSGRILADILSTALYVASTRTLFFVDDELVVAHWGMIDRADPEAPSVLPRLGSYVDIEPEPDPEPEPVEEPRVPPVRWPRAYWIVSGLMVLLLLMLAAFMARDQIAEYLPKEVLTISETMIENKDLAFLEGEWEIVSELHDTRSGEAVKARYVFKADGTGEIQARLTDRNVLCTGSVKAQFEGRKLKLTHKQEMACEDQRKYNVLGVECEADKNGRARCAFHQKNRETMDVIIQKLNFWS
jgi:hypothetical protein